MGLVFQIEANDMGGKLDALSGKLLGEGARIGIAGLHTVGDQHDGGGGIAIGEQVGGMLHRGRDRRLAHRLYLVDGIDKACLVQRPRLNQGFDIAAVALAAMAIGNQAKMSVGIPTVDELSHHVTSDLDLAGAIDLPPHGPRGVIDNHDIFRGAGGCRRGEAACDHHGCQC